MKATDLNNKEFNSFYGGYINQIPEAWDLKTGFEIGKGSIVNFFKAIPKDKLEYRYAEGKWTVKEVFLHIIDTERVMMHRCFRIGRHDKTALAGFEQDDYIAPSKANEKSLEALIEEYLAVRQNSIILLNSLSSEDLKFIGHASGNKLSSRAAAFIVLGHEIWHTEIIKSRYL
ncbi:DinB family protein [Algibacter sp. L1A34]|uniref:DinB family protein n=1 Tax=Algibacter sp. L1A34 TaxID=2686365 RepID=UPI00131CEFB8|nr:DinB family protein [Algibacter sp. L1A34]